MLTFSAKTFDALTADAERRFRARLRTTLDTIIPADAARLARNYVSSLIQVTDSAPLPEGPEPPEATEPPEGWDGFDVFIRDALALSSRAEVDEDADQAALICLLAMEERCEPGNEAVFRRVGALLGRDDPGHVRVAMVEAHLADLSTVNADAGAMLAAMRQARGAF